MVTKRRFVCTPIGRTTRQESGFSLVELMIVVAIIGILASLAIPKFQTFQSKARQAEAKTNLGHVYTLEQSYFADNEKYIAVAATGRGTVCPANDIGFRPAPCDKSRYAYSVTVPTDAEFVAAADSGINADNKVFPNCATADLWQINQEHELSDVNNALAACQ